MQDLTSKDQIDFSKMRYGSLSYDIPKEFDDLANLIRSKIRTYALMIHESGYIVPWQHKDMITDIVKTAILATNDNRKRANEREVKLASEEKRQPKLAPEIARPPKVRVFLIDSDSNLDVLDEAKDAMDRFVNDITESFQKRTAAVIGYVEKAIEDKKIEINDKAKEIANRKRAIIRELRKKVSDAEGVFVWFAMSDSVKHALKAMTKLFDAELTALKKVAMLGETPMKQSEIPATEEEKALFGE